MRAWLPIIFIGLLLSACSTRDTTAQQRAASLRTYYGSAEVFTTSIRLIARPKDRDLLSFNVRGSRAQDGRIRLTCEKHGVHFMEALIEPNGGFTAVLDAPDQQATITGTLAELDADLGDGAAVFTELQSIVNELASGPISKAETIEFTSEEKTALRLTFADNSYAVATINGQIVSEKHIHNADESLRYSLKYFRRTDPYDDIYQRSPKMDLIIPGDETKYIIRLNNFDSVPGISGASMKLDIPADWPKMGLKEFLQLLVE